MRSNNNRMVTEMFANFPFFLLEYVFPTTELAGQKIPVIRMNNNRKTGSKIFVSYLRIKLYHGIWTITVLGPNMLCCTDKKWNCPHCPPIPKLLFIPWLNFTGGFPNIKAC